MKIDHLWGKVAVLAVVCLGALLILLYYYGAAGGRLPTASHRYTVHALVEPQQVLKHADVRAAGVTVGEVADVTGAGTKANVELALEKEVAPVYENATVLVRQKTLVGENYIELVRGTPDTGQVADGGTLPGKASLEAVPIDRVLNSLDKETRARVSTNLKALGGAFDGRAQDVNRLAADLAPLTTEGSQVTDILAAQKRQVADLVAQGNTVLSALADRRGDLTTLLKAARTTASAVAERDTQLKSAFAELPSTLRQAQGSVGRLSGFSGRAVPVVGDLRAALADLTPVVQDLGPTATAANRLFDELPAFTAKANPLLDTLRTFSSSATPTFPALDALLRQANPALRYLEPYKEDLTHTLAVFGGNEYYDKYGGIGRCTCPAGEHSFANFSPAMLQAANILLKSKLVTQIEDTHANPYRKPGIARTAGRTDFGGDYPVIQADPPASAKK